MHTRLRVVAAILFPADHSNRNHQRGLSSPFDTKKQLNRLAELQSKVTEPRINDQRAVIRE
jgi:hypothetical protein